MTTPEPVRLGGRAWWVLEHPTLGLRTHLGCPVLYCSRVQADKAVEREIGWDRKSGWAPVEVSLERYHAGNTR